MCYFNGYGVAKDMVEAVKWLRKSADQGYADAYFDLGECYRNGYGVTKDMVEAVKWLRKSANLGYVDAQFRLGFCYANGLGVEKNMVEAYAYFKLAGITDEVARNNLAILEKGLSPVARIRGQQRAKEMQKEIEAKRAGK